MQRVGPELRLDDLRLPDFSKHRDVEQSELYVSLPRQDGQFPRKVRLPFGRRGAEKLKIARRFGGINARVLRVCRGLRGKGDKIRIGDARVRTESELGSDRT